MVYLLDVKSCESPKHDPTPSGSSSSGDQPSPHSDSASTKNGNGNGNGNGKKNGASSLPTFQAPQKLFEYIPEKNDKSAHIKKAILTLFAAGEQHVGRVCKQVEIAPQTFYEWMILDDPFFQCIQKAKAIRIFIAEDKLFELVEEKDLGAICFFLSNRDQLNWKNSRSVNDHTFGGAVSVKVEYGDAK